MIITHADWLNEKCLEHARTFCLRVHATLSPSFSLSLSLSFYLSFSLSVSAYTLFTGQREWEKERERESEKEGDRERGGEIEMQNVAIEFISLLLTMAALRFKFFLINCYFYF